MPYAALQDLILRAGRLSGAWTNASTPSNPTDLNSLLTEASAQIDALLESKSVSVPVVGNAAAALGPLNARMALLEALRATFPSKTGPQEASELIDSLAEQLYGKDGRGGEWGSLMDGTHPAVAALIAEGSVPTATSFWDREPDYGMLPDPVDIANTNPQMLPFWSRLSRF